MKKGKYKAPLFTIVQFFNNDVLATSIIIQDDGGLGIGFDDDLWGGGH